MACQNAQDAFKKILGYLIRGGKAIEHPEVSGGKQHQSRFKKTKIKTRDWQASSPNGMFTGCGFLCGT